MLRMVFLVGGIALLSGCAVPTTYTRGAHPTLFAAMDTRNDGATGTVPQTGEKFTIVSTHVNSAGTLLCRVVSFKAPNSFRTKTFCKRKGGEWK